MCGLVESAGLKRVLRVQKLQSPNNQTNGATDPAGRKLPAQHHRNSTDYEQRLQNIDEKLHISLLTQSYQSYSHSI